MAVDRCGDDHTCLNNTSELTSSRIFGVSFFGEQNLYPTIRSSLYIGINTLNGTFLVRRRFAVVWDTFTGTDWVTKLCLWKFLPTRNTFGRRLLISWFLSLVDQPRTARNGRWGWCLILVWWSDVTCAHHRARISSSLKTISYVDGLHQIVYVGY